jgi:hypothetical protein
MGWAKTRVITGDFPCVIKFHNYVFFVECVCSRVLSFARIVEKKRRVFPRNPDNQIFRGQTGSS